MKKNFQNKKQIWKQIVSLFLVIAMVLSMAPVSSFNVQAEETSQVSEEQVTMKLHYNNSGNWSTVYVYAGESDESDDWVLTTNEWPGNQLTQGSDGYYTYETTTGTSKFNFIFNNGSDIQTGNLCIDAAILEADADGIVDVWVDGSGNMTYVDGPKVNGNEVTFRYKNDSVASVELYGSMNEWISGYTMTKDEDGVWTYTTTLAAGEYFYKFVVDGTWITDPANRRYSDGNSVVVVSDYESPVVNGSSVTFNYSNDYATNVEVFGSMNSWTSGYTMTKGSDGLWTYTLTGLESGVIQYKFVVTYEDGTQTWIADPANSNSMGSDGNSVAIVPGLLGANVSGKKGSTITLPASLNYLESDGTTTKKTVTYSEVEGVTVNGTTVTVPETYTGTKFDLTATTSDNLTATVTVGLYETNEITIKIHYVRSDGDYTDWNAWVWSDNVGGKQYDFEDEAGGKVTTVTVEDGLYTNSMNFIIRKGDWKAQEATRTIDISDVVSGTVHYYVNADGSTSVDKSEAIQGIKINSIEYSRTTNKITIITSQEVINPDTAFTLKCLDETELTITKVEQSGTTCKLTIEKDLSTLEAITKSYFIIYDGNSYAVTMPNIYSTDEFEEEYTYDGDDLGAAWTKESTTFKVWAPTADDVKVRLYKSGTEGTDDLIKTVDMVRGDKGVWSVTVESDLNGTYYTYLTNVNGELEESCDPYARTTGVNGERAMVIDLDSTDPEGWAEDVSPNKDMDYTDAIIYELHVRDFSIDDSSGVSDENQGKFLAFTEEGTTLNDEEGAISTGIDYLKELGVTHLHLLPIYDYASVDETKLDTAQFNWGYDPKNYNTPEGSYSTDPYNGEVRVKEMKKMVKSLHDNNINVIMDVVYNHVYDAGTFCVNEIVPNYFSRTNADGSYSNGSGCGNDTASERSMVRKYIVDSVTYWADEYHIDGFRFDLVGLLDAETINQVVEEVHKTHPDVIFYGEGWTMGTAVDPSDTVMATQANASSTPDFAYFSDTIRNLLAGKNGETTGFVSGLTGQEEPIADCFKATTWWCPKPAQTVNYASCHDNYTLMDKLKLTRSDATETDIIKMNNLAASIYMMSEGIPFIHAGEEFLREKIDTDGTRVENSYNASDYVNSLKWNELATTAGADTSEYYKGLIEFRKNHASLRLATAEEVAANVTYKWITNEVVLFDIKGKGSVADEVSDGIVVIFNATTNSKSFNLGTHGIDVSAEWKVCINGEDSGTEVLDTIIDGNVTVEPISALVLVKGETVDTDSVYVKNTKVETEPVSYNVTVTSAIEGATGTVATVTGGGVYEAGATATVTAPAMEGYTFLGWYVASDNENGYAETPESTTLAYSFEVTETKDLVAVYQANGKATLKIEGTDFRVNGGSVQVASGYSKSHTLGTTITIEYVGDANFYYWKDINGKIVSTNSVYSFTLTGDTVLTPVYMSKDLVGYALVEFVSAYGQIMQASTYTTEDEIDFPAGPSKAGKVFKGWTVDEETVVTSEAIVEMIAQGETYIRVVPLYESTGLTYTVSVVVDGDFDNVIVYEDLSDGSVSLVEAPEVEGRQFAYWSDSLTGEKVLGYSNTYPVRVREDVVLYAIYVEEGTAVERKPVVEITDAYAFTESDVRKISFVATHDVPEGYTLVEHGILRGTDSSLGAEGAEDIFVTTSSLVKKEVAADNTSRGVFSFTLQVGTYVDRVLYVRGYMIVENNVTGNEETIYSDICYGSYNSLDK